MSRASETQAEETRRAFLELRDEDDEEYGLPVREEETHALLELHRSLVEDGGDAELREYVEDELQFRDSGSGPKMPPVNVRADWDWRNHLE